MTTSLRRASLALICCPMLWIPSAGAETPIDDAITISSPAALLAKRQALISYVWGSSGMPAATATAEPATGLSPTVFGPYSSVSKLTVSMTAQAVTATGATYEVMETTEAYHFVVNNGNDRLVILHYGHGCSLLPEQPVNDIPGQEQFATGLQRSIKQLVTEGFSVLAIFLVGCTSDAHHAVMSLTLSAGQHPMRFFLEPIAICLNYLRQNFPNYHEYAMAGLSGGGWATTLYAAIDPTITKSFPVAGSLPFDLGFNTASYERFRIDEHGQPTDGEQWDPGFYHIAAYRDLYVLGSYGAGRRQVQILNRRDNCCFGEAQHDQQLPLNFGDSVRAYERAVRAALKGLGPGSFRVEIDEASTSHMISWNAVVGVILAELNDDRRSVGAATTANAFVRGMNGNLWWYHAGAWSDTGLAAVGVPAVVENCVHQIDLVYRTPQNGLRHAFLSNGSWIQQAWSGRVITDPVVVPMQTGLFAVVALGVGYQPFVWTSGSQGGFTRISTVPLLGPPALIARSSSTVDVVGRDKDRAAQLFEYSLSAGSDSASQTSVGGVMWGFPAASVDVSRRVFVRGQSKTLWAADDASGAWLWASVGDETGTASLLLDGSPAVALTGSSTRAYMRKLDGAGVARFTRQAAWGFSDLGGSIESSPTAVADGLFGRAPDGSLALFDASGWHALGGRLD
jgi:hypothetical protein